ncbi:hypothetical protein PI126_g5480 [Phytophthora idaei]|nr:hypothetical protein PI126_g5480 [Phytophthora idaei]
MRVRRERNRHQQWMATWYRVAAPSIFSMPMAICETVDREPTSRLASCTFTERNYRVQSGASGSAMTCAAIQPQTRGNDVTENRVATASGQKK